MNVLNLLSELVKAIGLFINPKQNATLTQRIGSFLSILTVLGMLAGAVNTLLPVDVPEPGASPDVVQPLDVPTPGDVHEDVPAGILGAIGAALSAPFGCSGAQQAVVKASSADLLACFVDIAASESTVALKQWGSGYKINVEDLGIDAVSKALPCLLKFGAVAISTYALPPGRWGGSAGEKNVYRGDGVEIIVSPGKK